MDTRVAESFSTGIGRFFMVGVSYRNADVALRGSFSLGPDRYASLLENADRYGLAEIFVLSTCNRTELYALADGPEMLLRAMAAECAQDVHLLEPIAEVRQGREAVDHLFQVTAGIDSQLLGDYEIVGQIKAAARFAKERGGAGPFMERLLNESLRVSKSIKNRTSITKGTVSVAFAAVRYLEDVPAIQDRRIVVIGAGKMGRSACLHLVEHLGCRNVTLMNRTDQKAIELAGRCGMKARAYAELSEAVREADVIIAATNATSPIIQAEMIGGEKEQWLLDLGMPENIDPAIGELPARTLLNVDKISRITDATLRQRSEQVPVALGMIAAAVDEFLEWSRLRERFGLLADVKRKLETIHARNAFADPDSHQRIKDVMKGLAVAMRRGDGHGCDYIRAINEYITAANACNFIVRLPAEPSPYQLHSDRIVRKEINA